MTEPTIVSCYFDIGRGSWEGPNLPHYLKRTNDQYFENFERLLKLKNPIVVFTSQDMDIYDRFTAYESHPNLTVISFADWKADIWPEFFGPISRIQNDTNFQKMILQPWNPEYWNTSYVMVNMLKAYFVNYAIESGFVKTDLAAWADFGYARKDEDVPTDVWSYDFDPEKIHVFSVEKYVPLHMDIKNVIATNQVMLMGCHIITGKERWKDLLELMYQNMVWLLNRGLCDDDQTLIWLSYIQHPELFEIHYLDSNHPSGWFQIFHTFNQALDQPL